MIIDFRVRPPFKSLAALKHFKPGLIRPQKDILKESLSSLGRQYIPSANEKSIDLFLREMDDAGIGKAVVMGRVNDKDRNAPGSDNADVRELALAYPGRFIPFASLDPTKEGAAEEAERCLGGLGFKGLSFDLGYIELYPDDARMEPLYEIASAHKAVVSLAASCYIGPDLTYSDPTPLQRVAARFPDVTFVLPHACWPHIDKALGVASMCPNVYLSPDVYMSAPNAPFAEALVAAANGFLKGQIVFASSYPIRGLGESVANWANLPLDKDALWRAYYYNAARIFDL